MRGKREDDGCRKRHGKWWKRRWKRTKQEDVTEFEGRFKKRCRT
jgi:hypothetical protein